MSKYMQMCLELAKNAEGSVSPNPLVGAVIVKNDKVIATGFHKKAGKDHAELDAIKNAKESLEGATLYCNLEPCCHTNKKTAPCAQRIIKEKISKVVIANLDPNPEVSGKGVDLLRENGIEVETCIMENEGNRLNEIFFCNMKKEKAFIEIKLAQSLDGKIAANSGHSKWITSAGSRELVHKHRNIYDAIMVGAETARIDNPRLTVRMHEHISGKIRLVVSTTGDLSKDLDIFNDDYSHLTFLVLPEGVTPKLKWQYISCPIGSDGLPDLNKLSNILYKDHGICSVYVEGGKTLHTMYLKQKAFDRISIFIAPKLIGEGVGPFGDLDINNVNDAVILSNLEWKSVGQDLYLTTTR